VGPGNFHLVRLGAPGANIVRQNLAGGYNQCLDLGDDVDTEPGVENGPVAQGLNTRFGQYQGGMNRDTYPPDTVTTETNPPLTLDADGSTVILRGGGTVNSINDVSFTYDDYTERQASGQFDFPDGVPLRRVLAVPFVDCSGFNAGQSTLPLVGLGCFFLLQPVQQGGPGGGGNDSNVFAQFIGDCEAGGTPGPAPNPNPVANTGLYKIVLHNDPSSPDS
jgi:hypothetical protein